jgi:serine/threonine-protein kinase
VSGEPGVSLLHPVRGKKSGGSSFPSDLFELTRSRLRLIAGFFVVAFGVDLLLFSLGWLIGVVRGEPLPPDAFADGRFQVVNLGAVLASAALWWATRNARIPTARLHALGIGYEILLCFTITILAYWPYYLSYGLLPNLTWVSAVVIMFPLILPGPPRRMLAVALAAAATAPLALLLLDLTGQVPAAAEAYFQATVGPTIAACFAYFAASVVYGLGREVAAARALGSYELVERLGEGGMGEVWRARHRLLARPAAIKLIRPALVSAEAMRRFEREAQAIASLRSPHTVELFDFGAADDGSFYYAMELLDGLDTEALVKRFGPMPAERAIHVLGQLCHSLSEAESRGLVHRDIKPANIFLCRYGEDHDFVKVLDFGIVKPHRPAGVELALTDAGGVQGTPAFMAPEQALGEAALDGRTDIYAAGCVGYWLLTGQLVFSATTAVALLMQHVNSEPARPSTRTGLPIPGDLEQLILSCLAKRPADRPQTAKELRRRLDGLGAAQAWTEGRAREWWTERGLT